MFDTTTRYAAQSTPSTAVGCSPMKENPVYPPPMPLIADVSADKLARLLRDAREIGAIQGPDTAVYLADRLFPNDARRALQFLNLADPMASNAA